MLLESSCPGVLAVGDVRSGSIKRVASAVGEGSMAVRLVHEYLAGATRPARHSAPYTQVSSDRISHSCGQRSDGLAGSEDRPTDRVEADRDLGCQ
jgi:hypothetical protein